MKWYKKASEDPVEWAQRMVTQPKKEDKKERKTTRLIQDSEGMWVSPERNYMPVSEHIMSVKEKPEWFGLAERDVEKIDPFGGGFAEVFKDIIGRGYIRYRYFSDPEATRHLFDVKSYEYAKPVIERILWAKMQDGFISKDDNVSVFQGNGKVFEGKVGDVLEEKVSFAAAKNLSKVGRSWSCFFRKAQVDQGKNY